MISLSCSRPALSNAWFIRNGHGHNDGDEVVAAHDLARSLSNSAVSAGFKFLTRGPRRQDRVELGLQGSGVLVVGDVLEVVDHNPLTCAVTLHASPPYAARRYSWRRPVGRENSIITEGRNRVAARMLS